MAMTAFELFGVLKLDKSDFDKGLDNADKKASSFGSSLSSGLSKAVGIGLKAVTAATAAVGAFATSAVAVGSSFDQAMGDVAATAGKTVDELNETLGEVDTAYGHFSGTLRDFAMYMGQNTTFSATEAAQALNYMALAGYDTQQSMEMLPSVLSMAAAGGMELAKASDAITDIQSALGLEFERTGDMVNEFAKAAASGNTSVEQLSDAFLVVGGLARELNGGMITLSDGTQKEVDGVQELEIAFTAMANAGVKGSEAGTHMRNMLLKLSSPTDDGATAMEKLGVKVFDTEGKMRSLSDIFGDLSSAMAGNVTPAFTDFYNKFAEMTPEAIAKEFKKSADDFDYFGISVVDEEGKLKDFNAVLGEVQARFGEGLTQEAKIGAISDLFNTRDMASAEALLNAVDTQWDSLGEKITDAAGAADEMSKTKLDNLAGDIKLWNSALETAQITINDKLSPYMRKFVKLGTTGLQDLVTAFSEGGLEGAMTSFGDTLSKGLDMVVQMLPDAINAGMQLLGALGQGIIDNLPQIVDAAVQIAVQLSEGLVQALPQLAQGAVTLVQSLAQSFSENSETLLSAGAQLLELVWQGITTGLPMLAQGAVELMGNLATYLQEAIPQLFPVAMNALMEFSGSLRENAGLLIDGALNLIMTLAQGLIDGLPTLIETIPTIVTNIAGIINDNAPKLIATGIELIGKLVIGIVQAIPTIIAEFPKIVQAIFAVITAVNWVNLGAHIITFIGNGIKSLATSIPNMLKNIGQNGFNFLKNIDWRNLGSTVINFIVNGIKSLITNIPNLLKSIGMEALNLFKNINWFELGINVVAGIASGLMDAAGMIWDAITDIAQGAWDAITGFFDMHSPSKKMMWVGKMIDEGMAKGITKSADLVSDAMDDLAVLPQTNFESTTNTEPSASKNVSVIMNIYGAVGQDVEELAEIVSRKIDVATSRRMYAMGVTE